MYSTETVLYFFNIFGDLQEEDIIQSVQGKNGIALESWKP